MNCQNDFQKVIMVITAVIRVSILVLMVATCTSIPNSKLLTEFDNGHEEKFSCFCHRLVFSPQYNLKVYSRLLPAFYKLQTMQQYDPDNVTVTRQLVSGAGCKKFTRVFHVLKMTE